MYCMLECLKHVDKWPLSPCLPPPITTQACDEDVSQFDRKFTELTPIDSPVDSNISESANLNFQGFSYVAPSLLAEEIESQSFRHRPRYTALLVLYMYVYGQAEQSTYMQDMVLMKASHLNTVCHLLCTPFAIVPMHVTILLMKVCPFTLLSVCLLTTRSPRKGLMSPRLKAQPTKQVFGFSVDSITHMTSMAPDMPSQHPLESVLLSSDHLPHNPSNGHLHKCSSQSSNSSSGISDEESTDSSSRSDEVDGRYRKGSPHSVSPPIDTKSFHTNRKITPPSNRPAHLRFTWPDMMSLWHRCV